MNKKSRKNKFMKRVFFSMLLSLLSWNSFSQDVTIRGEVLDVNRIPLIGVNVVEVGTSNGTVTDIDGKFILDVSETDALLQLTYIGYETLQVEIAGRSHVTITMQESTSQLNEVVVVGYGTQKKVNLTGSVDAISGDEIKNRSAVNIGDLVKGASPNLNIT